MLVDLGPDWQGLDPADRVLSDGETAVRAELTSLRDLGEGRIEVAGWAYLDQVDLTDRSRDLTLTLRSGAAAVDVPVTDRPAPEADVAGELWWADVTGSGFVAVVDTTTLRGGTGVWHLDASVSVAGLSATGRATVRPWTMAGVPAWADADDRHWHLDHDDAQQAELRVRRTPWPEVGPGRRRRRAAGRVRGGRALGLAGGAGACPRAGLAGRADRRTPDRCPRRTALDAARRRSRRLRPRRAVAGRRCRRRTGAAEPPRHGHRVAGRRRGRLGDAWSTSRSSSGSWWATPSTPRSPCWSASTPRPATCGSTATWSRRPCRSTARAGAGPTYRCRRGTTQWPCGERVRPGRSPPRARSCARPCRSRSCTTGCGCGSRRSRPTGPASGW